MKRAFKLFGTRSRYLCAIALITLIGFSFAACNDGSTNGSSGGSTSLAGKTFVGMGGLMKITFTASKATTPSNLDSV